MTRAAPEPAVPTGRRLTIRRTLVAMLVFVVLVPLGAMAVMGATVTDFGTIGEQMRGVGVGWLALGIVVFFLQYPLLAARWRILLNVPDAAKPNLVRMSGLMLVAHLFDMVIPGPAGDLAVSYIIKVRHKVTMAQATSAGAYGRLLGLVVLAGTPFAVAPAFTDKLPEVVAKTLNAGLVVALVGVGIMGLLAIFPRGWEGLVTLSSRLLPGALRDSPGLIGRAIRALVGFLVGFADNARLIGASPARMTPAFALSVGTLAVNVFYLYTVFRAFGEVHPFHFVAFAFCTQVLSHTTGILIPGVGNVTGPVVGLAVMHGLMAVAEPTAVAILFVSWSPIALASIMGFFLALPSFRHIADSIQGVDVGDDPKAN